MSAEEAAAARAAGEQPLGRAVGSYVVSKTWIWAASETLHFIGLCMLFGIATLVDLRMLGMMKSVPFAALHQLLPWAVLGFGINLITGMLFFVAAYEQYTTNAGLYHWKLGLIMLAGLNVLYFTIFDEPWALAAGESASATAKFVRGIGAGAGDWSDLRGPYVTVPRAGLLMIIALMVAATVLGAVVAIAVVGYLIDKSADQERD